MGTYYPLTAPAVRPDTMCFWAIKNIMIAGMVVRVMNAKMRFMAGPAMDTSTSSLRGF